MFRRTAAWRISIWPTLAFAIGAAAAFAIIYFVVASTVRSRTDAWLAGEAGVLAEVSTHTPKDRLYSTIVGEVAELAERELPDERSASGQRLNSVFFLDLHGNGSNAALWVGPGTSDPFRQAVATTSVGAPPQSLTVQGWQTPFRVVARAVSGQDQVIYLGLSDRADLYLLQNILRRFLLIWGATALLGFVISYASARQTLRRVEHITETVAKIDSQDLGERLPDSVNRDEISRLSRTFNLMLDRIQSSVNQLRSVTDAVAHDLKSPVTSIRGRLEAALCADPSTDWRESVGTAIEDLDRLLNLLNTTLDLAEAEAGALRLDRRPVDLSDLVRQLIDLYSPAMHERHHEIAADVAPHVVISADSFLLSRMLSNLFENELTHLPDRCHISFRLRQRENTAELTIEDSGPGFPPEIAANAFQRFVKGQNSPGHGLGLAFVEAVVKAHGGAISVGNRPDSGAIIIVSLPSGVHAPPEAPPPRASQQSAKSAD